MLDTFVIPRRNNSSAESRHLAGASQSEFIFITGAEWEPAERGGRGLRDERGCV